MRFAINQIYGPDFNRKQHTPKDVSVTHQQQDQERGIEQRKAAIRKRRRDLIRRIERNKTMAEIINTARQNIAKGNIVKVGVR